MILLLAFSPLGYGQQQYSEGACILLQQQADRFAHQPQNRNYRSAKREYDKYCRKPVAPRPVATNSNPAPIANNIAVAVPVKQATIPAAATPAAATPKSQRDLYSFFTRTNAPKRSSKTSVQSET